MTLTCKFPSTSVYNILLGRGVEHARVDRASTLTSLSVFKNSYIVSDTVFKLFHVVACILFSMVALITTYFKESDWLLEQFDQSEIGSRSHHGKKLKGNI